MNDEVATREQPMPGNHLAQLKANAPDEILGLDGPEARDFLAMTLWESDHRSGSLPKHRYVGNYLLALAV